MTTIYNPVNVQIGPGTLDLLPSLLNEYGKKVLLVHAHRPVEDGLLQKVRVVLDENNIPHADLGQILPDPKFDSVLRGVKLAKDEGCGLVLSLGGGSTLQCARGIAYGLKDDDKKDLWDFWNGKRKPKDAAIVAAILTNPASDDELSDACTLIKDGKKKTLRSKYGYCAFAILDPNLSDVPLYPAMCQSFEIFTLVFDRYLMAEGFLENLDFMLCQEIITTALAMKNGDVSGNRRSSLYWSELLCHITSQKADVTMEKLARNLALKCALPSGLAMAALFDAWLQSQPASCLDKIRAIARILPDGKSLADNASMEAIRPVFARFISELTLPNNLEQAGVSSHTDLKDLLSPDEMEQKLLDNAR